MARKKKENKKMDVLVEENNQTDDLVGRALDKMLPKNESKSKIELNEDNISEKILGKTISKDKSEKGKDKDWLKRLIGM